VRFTAAYGTWLLKRNAGKSVSVVVGRDGRTTGKMVANIVINTLQGLGINVTDLGLATTPTVEMDVVESLASGGIIITASHNPANWNALKLLDENGEFLKADEGNEVIEIAAGENFEFAPHEKLGSLSEDSFAGIKHIEKILGLKLVDVNAIKEADFKVVVDCINSVGGLIIPVLLNKLGVRHIIAINNVPDGNFAHNPEPIPENLKQISAAVVKEKADVGFVVDPDVDRLAIISEDGTMFGEEYTLVSVADYVLSVTPGDTVSNMSSTRALREISGKYGRKHFTSAVGEVNVVDEMKRRGAVIGGEGNGGVIYPELHYGRDALLGIALFLSNLAKKKMKCTELRSSYPDYFIAKKKMTIDPSKDMDEIFRRVKDKFRDSEIDERDGIMIENSKGWVQLRKSNTEPIIRIYAEGRTEAEAELLADEVMMIVKKL
jgi:phosphomannomutase